MQRSHEPWQIEIVELHEFFVAWFRGDLPNDDAGFARLERALAPDFRMIVPSGALLERDELVERLRQAHGAQPEFVIEIEDMKERLRAGDLRIATYVEYQPGRTPERRWSTVVLRDDARAPHGVVWAHVHETAMA